jgi:hypothetical protein
MNRLYFSAGTTWTLLPISVEKNWAFVSVLFFFLGLVLKKKLIFFVPQIFLHAKRKAFVIGLFWAYFPYCFFTDFLFFQEQQTKICFI